MARAVIWMAALRRGAIERQLFPRQRSTEHRPPEPGVQVVPQRTETTEDGKRKMVDGRPPTAGRRPLDGNRNTSYDPA
jgi:hypothetical protein